MFERERRSGSRGEAFGAGLLAAAVVASLGGCEDRLLCRDVRIHALNSSLQAMPDGTVLAVAFGRRVDAHCNEWDEGDLRLFSLPPGAASAAERRLSRFDSEVELVPTSAGLVVRAERPDGSTAPFAFDLLDARTLEVLAPLPDVTGSGSAASPTGRFVLARELEKIDLLDAHDPLRDVQPAAMGERDAAAWANTEDRLFVVTCEPTLGLRVRSWDAGALAAAGFPLDPAGLFAGADHDESIAGLACESPRIVASPDDARLAVVVSAPVGSGAFGPATMVYDLATRTPTLVPDVAGLATFSPTGDVLAGAAVAGTLAGHAVVTDLVTTETRAVGAAVGPRVLRFLDDRHLLVGGEGGEIERVDLVTGTTVGYPTFAGLDPTVVSGGALWYLREAPTSRRIADHHDQPIPFFELVRVDLESGAWRAVDLHGGLADSVVAVPATGEIAVVIRRFVDAEWLASVGFVGADGELRREVDLPLAPSL